MPYPEFFDAAPRITVRDPLARVLGAAEDGVIEYRYTDAVKLAGHSCPTVASADLMTRAALGALYPNTLPGRGGIRVELRNDRLEGATGVSPTSRASLPRRTTPGSRASAGTSTGATCCSSASTSRGNCVSRAPIPEPAVWCPPGSTACRPIPAWFPSCSTVSPAPRRPTKQRVSNRYGKAGSGRCWPITPTIPAPSSFNANVIPEELSTGRPLLLFPLRERSDTVHRTSPPPTKERRS